MMEAAVISADIQEVVGSAIALLLLSNGWLPLWMGCILTGVDTFTFLAVQHLGVRSLEPRTRTPSCPPPPPTSPQRRPHQVRYLEALIGILIGVTDPLLAHSPLALSPLAHSP